MNCQTLSDFLKRGGYEGKKFSWGKTPDSRAEVMLTEGPETRSSENRLPHRNIHLGNFRIEKITPSTYFNERSPRATAALIEGESEGRKYKGFVDLNDILYANLID
jgi:hypothetical protein